MDKKKIPDRLYKYHAFSSRTLDMLLADSLFFADPTTFNDPLDTKPSLKTDLDDDKLKNILIHFFEQRVDAEMTAAAETLRYLGPKTIENIARYRQQRVNSLIADILYAATDPSYTGENPERYFFGQYIEEELLRRYDKGVVSLAGREICPLMWSHYADQHRGVCFGYSVPNEAAVNLYKIRYGGSRMIAASEVAAMLAGEEEARRKVDEAVLLKKAIDWRYEREWRLIGPRGLQNSPLELEEVIFGMRCKSAVKYAVFKALEKRRRGVKFYEIRERHATFLLRKHSLDTGELSASFPRRTRDLQDAFESVP